VQASVFDNVATMEVRTTSLEVLHVRFGSLADFSRAIAMSALPPKADIVGDAGQTHSWPPKAALCHKRTSRHSFDHLVGAGQKQSGKLYPECLRGLEVQNEIELIRLLDG
jgi:hypothetical protein